MKSLVTIWREDPFLGVVAIAIIVGGIVSIVQAVAR